MEMADAAPLTCWEFACHRPRKLILIIGLGVALGLAMTAAIWTFIEVTSPIYPMLKGWRIEPAHDDKGAMLVLSYHSQPTMDCNRNGNYYLTQIDPETGRGRYMLVGGTLNGASYRSELSVPDFDMLVPVRDVPAGKWIFTYRIDFVCHPFWLVHHAHVTPPIEVIIP